MILSYHDGFVMEIIVWNHSFPTPTFLLTSFWFLFTVIKLTHFLYISTEVEVIFPNGKKTKAATGAKLKDVASKAGYNPNYGCEVWLWIRSIIR